MQSTMWMSWPMPWTAPTLVCMFVCRRSLEFPWLAESNAYGKVDK